MRYLFEDYVFDTQRCELRHRADLVPVEPQVFDLLALSYRQPRTRCEQGRTARGDLAGGRVVSETALTSRINSARCAIGDSGHQALACNISFNVVGRRCFLSRSRNASSARSCSDFMLSSES